MAAQLWFLRHGDAEPQDARPDVERRLTEKGERQARAAGAALARMGIECSVVFTSPRVRARDTARLACEPLGLEPVVHEPLSEGFDAREALALLKGPGADGPVLVVGHEPDFSQVVHDLTGGRVDLKKGGVAAVRLDGTRGELIVLLRPRELELIAGCSRGRRPSSIGRVPELPEVEITARRLDAALRGAHVESALAPGVNALKTFDPPLHALEGRAIRGRGGGGKLFVIDFAGDLSLLVHLMSAGPPPALRQARGPARPHLAPARPPRGRARAAPARVRHQAGGVGEGAPDGRGRDRRGAGGPRARGVARPAAVRGAAARAPGRCTGCCATST